MTAKIPFHLLKSDEMQTGQTPNTGLRYQAEFSLNDLAPQNHSVYQIQESSLRPPTEKSSHWSVAWSDLMMTMFILFLSLFVYQAAHKDFLVSDKDEVVAGDTRKALEIGKTDEATFPFMVIKPSAPLITAGTVNKIESIPLQEIDLDDTFSSDDMDKTIAELARQIPPPPPIDEPRIAPPPEKSAVAQASVKPDAAAMLPPSKPIETVLQPIPLIIDTTSETNSVNRLFSASKKTLDIYNLNEFASIDLVPDKAVRIVLTGDLLFQTGAAALSKRAVHSLEKIAAAIQQTPHQIHIEGHTDDVPILAGQYANNWELSIARANAVATFLIEDMGMDPKQFVISGYSSYNPVVPNTTAANKAANRRVEIVIAQATPEQNIALTANQTSFFQTL